MYEIALCDDDLTFFNTFKPMLSDIFSKKLVSYKLDYYKDTASLKTEMQKGKEYDLIFLDILLENGNGLDFAKSMRSHKNETDIIFVSSNPDFALDGYEVSPLHYLIKPLTHERLETAVNRFLKNHATTTFTINTSNKIILLALSDILYFEVYNHTIDIKKVNGEHETLSGSLNKIEELLSGTAFVRTHKSFLVNMTYISKITRYKVTLSCGDTIPIGKTRYNNIQNCFIDFAAQNSPDFLP